MAVSVPEYTHVLGLAMCTFTRLRNNGKQHFPLLTQGWCTSHLPNAAIDVHGLLIVVDEQQVKLKEQLIPKKNPSERWLMVWELLGYQRYAHGGSVGQDWASEYLAWRWGLHNHDAYPGPRVLPVVINDPVGAWWFGTQAAAHYHAVYGPSGLYWSLPVMWALASQTQQPIIGPLHLGLPGPVAPVDVPALTQPVRPEDCELFAAPYNGWVKCAGGMSHTACTAALLPLLSHIMMHEGTLVDGRYDPADPADPAAVDDRARRREGQRTVCEFCMLNPDVRKASDVVVVLTHRGAGIPLGTMVLEKVSAGPHVALLCCANRSGAGALMINVAKRWALGDPSINPSLTLWSARDPFYLREGFVFEVPSDADANKPRTDHNMRWEPDRAATDRWTVTPADAARQRLGALQEVPVNHCPGWLIGVQHRLMVPTDRVAPAPARAHGWWTIQPPRRAQPIEDLTVAGWAAWSALRQVDPEERLARLRGHASYRLATAADATWRDVVVEEDDQRWLLDRLGEPDGRHTDFLKAGVMDGLRANETEVLGAGSHLGAIATNLAVALLGIPAKGVAVRRPARLPATWSGAAHLVRGDPPQGPLDDECRRLRRWVQGDDWEDADWWWLWTLTAAMLPPGKTWWPDPMIGVPGGNIVLLTSKGLPVAVALVTPPPSGGDRAAELTYLNWAIDGAPTALVRDLLSATGWRSVWWQSSWAWGTDVILPAEDERLTKESDGSGQLLRYRYRRATSKRDREIIDLEHHEIIDVDAVE